jgi:hypothetical protein
MNPGSMVGGEPTDNSWSLGNRRLRALTYAQISKRYMILLHFGINNQTFINGGASGTSGTGGYGNGKKPSCFFMMPGMNMQLFYLEKQENSVYL